MTTWQVGQTVSWPLEIRDETGVLADLGGGDPTATVTLPDTTTDTAVITHVDTGKYRADIVAAQEGRHLVTWEGSGTNSGALPYTDVADVWPVDPRLIVGLADAKNALNMLGTSRIDDDELRSYLVAATIVIEHLAGPKLQATVVETHMPEGKLSLPLWRKAASIVSVVEDGATLTAGSGYVWDPVGSILWRGSVIRGRRWTESGTVVVTYSTGSAVLPQNVTLAAAHLVAHWWRQTQQSPRPMLGIPANELGLPMVAGYAVPNIVTDLLSPSDTRLPGIA